MIIAHVKWFAEGGLEVPSYAFSEWYGWMFIGVILILSAFLLDRKVKGPNKSWMKWLKDTRSKWVYFFQVTLAASLIFAAANQVMLVPHYEANTLVVPILQVLAALFLILNRWVWIGAGLLLTSYLAAVLSFGPLESIEYINVLGMVAFLWLEKPLNNDWIKWKDSSLDILRISTGLALIILAFTEKLLSPGRALSFMADYEVNFMSVLGFDYSDRLFVMSAGSMELVFGVLMLLGLIPRINTLVLAGVLLSSNIFFFVQGYYSEGWVELMGHLPIIGTAVLLILYGKTFKKN
ncbi:MAG: putative membrane protein YphA (DoxX/SURF4 family) [Oceanicoccus sp.]|jgi:uncharacterized membrane protein YphA (DoxX/SURF4 family)